tara:strand:- start:132583 stop:132759 length:177 start_codon:yes stop_codon:yes gene_type:complete
VTNGQAKVTATECHPLFAPEQGNNSVLKPGVLASTVAVAQLLSDNSAPFFRSVQPEPY